jgi:hypothetical protein
MFWSFMDAIGIPVLAVVLTLWLLFRAPWWMLFAFSSLVVGLRATGAIQ